MATYLNQIGNPSSSAPLYYGVMGTDWWYLRKDPPAIDGEKTGWKSSITFGTTIDNYIPFVTAVGGIAVDVATSWGSMSRIAVLQHPLYPGQYAVRVKGRPIGTPSTTANGLMDQFSRAVVTVDFESYLYGTSGDTAYYTMESRAGGITTPIPGYQRYKFSTGEYLTSDYEMFTPQTSYVITINQAPNLNDSAMDALTDCVNAVPFLGKPAGQLKFDGWSGSLSATVGGVIQYTRTVMLTYQGYPWNQLYRSDGVLDTPTDSSSNPLFPLVDFTTMFN